ncbi:MAG: DUF1800 domain-containing protein [Acidobacteriota bacterium]|nr:DUF1800 domain-containing protein [Acidobacteriota bacterium]
MKRTWTGLITLVALSIAGCVGGISSGSGTKTPQPQNGQLVVSPASATLRGSDTQSFSATEGGAATTPAVTWSVNGVAGGNASFGTISPAGLYTAPEFPAAATDLTITAVESADATKTASSAVTLDNPIPQVTTIAPTSIPVGSFTLTVNGAHFATGAKVQFGAAVLNTTRVSSTKLTATGTAASTQVGNVAVSVKNPDPGTISSAAVMAKITGSSLAIAVSISPANATTAVNSNLFFVATVTGTSNQTVTWTLNGSGFGNPTIGYTNTTGAYAPPGIVPNPNTVTITATSVADPTKMVSGTITLVNPKPVLTAVSPTSIGVGAFMLTVTGSGFVNGSKVNFGGQPLTTMFVSRTELTATGTAAAAQAGNVAVTVTNPNPGTSTSGALNAQVVNGGQVLSASAAVRILEQSTFGPTPPLVNQLQQTGLDTFLQGQFNASSSTYPTPSAMDSGLTKVQIAFFKNAVYNSDQLRQRMAFALNELWVVGQNKVNDPVGYTNYISALTRDGLGNYYNVMTDVTLTPAMGHWLDMVNNDKPGTGQHANENYARELMQLFTLGLSQLNPDGTAVMDSTGMPVPTYTQDDVMALGRSLTGWTYPTEPGQTLAKHNPEYYGGNMVPFESNHDSGAKTFLGQSVAGGQSASQELDSVLTIIFNHPNLPPFVARRFIEKLVTSNPSPAYIQRVAQAFISGKFNTYGSGRRGDMKAMAAAILLDPEARRGDDSTTAVATDGKLREPVVMEVAVARAFGAASDGTGFTTWGQNMAQGLFNSPSVFNFFPPESLIPQTTLNGPEFAIFNTNTSLTRVNFINSAVYGQISSATSLEFTPVMTAGTPDQMMAWLDTQFLHGTMSDSMKQSILTAVNANSATDTNNQARTAIYLVLSSSQYQVQR